MEAKTLGLPAEYTSASAAEVRELSPRTYVAHVYHAHGVIRILRHGKLPKPLCH